MRLDHLAVVAVLAGSASLGSAAVGVSAIADDLPAASAPATTAPGPDRGGPAGDCDHHHGDRPGRADGRPEL